MKKTLAALCAAALLVSMACGVYALTGEDSLISLSYITNIFIPDAIRQGSQQAGEVLNKTYTGAEEELEEVLHFLNCTDYQKTVLIRRGKQIPSWGETE